MLNIARCDFDFDPRRHPRAVRARPRRALPTNFSGLALMRNPIWPIDSDRSWVAKPLAFATLLLHWFWLTWSFKSFENSLVGPFLDHTLVFRGGEGVNLGGQC